MEIEVLTVELTGEQLKVLPQDKRVFLVQAGHLANTIMILSKWLVFCEVRAEPSSVEAAAQATQQMLVMRILSGVLCEGWEVLRKSYFGKHLSKEYDGHLGDNGKQYLQELKRYFGRDNLIKRVRDKCAFHFDREPVEGGLETVPLDARYRLYLTEARGNSLYYLSEELIGLAILNGFHGLTDTAETRDPLRHLFKDLVSISRAFSTFLEACLVLIVQECRPPLTQKDCVPSHVSDVPAMEQIRIPFFVTAPNTTRL